MIPINLIRQYIFCPRIVYYNLLTNITPIFPRQVTLGLDYHELQNKMITHRKFKKLDIDYIKIINEFYLQDEKLNICGKVDMAFICENEVIPIEFKDIENKPSFSHIMQLYGYGILLEKKYNMEFKRAFIIHSNNMKFFRYDVNTEYKKKFFNIINEIEKILNSEILPNSDANENKCSQCEYLNYCDDRF